MTAGKNDQGREFDLEPPVDRHWYVPDVNDIFCLACGLPRENQRHAPRPEAA